MTFPRYLRSKSDNALVVVESSSALDSGYLEFYGWCNDSTLGWHQDLLYEEFLVEDFIYTKFTKEEMTEFDKAKSNYRKAMRAFKKGHLWWIYKNVPIKAEVYKDPLILLFDNDELERQLECEDYSFLIPVSEEDFVLKTLCLY